MHLWLAFPGYPGSYALVSQSERPTTALVFVHGFWGNAVETWQQFQTAVDDARFDATFSDLDLFFYDYASTTESIRRASEKFGTFLDRVLDVGPFVMALEGSTLRGLSGFDPTLSRRPYADLLFVGHSLGAVLIRKLIVDRAKKAHVEEGSEDRTPPILGRNPRLFAPAHSGFLHRDALSQVLGSAPILNTVLSLWQILWVRAYPDVQPYSPALISLRQETERIAELHPWRALRAVVLWSARDNVVHDVDYACDSTSPSVEGKTHQTICKPTHDYIDPVRFVDEGLR